MKVKKWDEFRSFYKYDIARYGKIRRVLRKQRKSIKLRCCDPTRVTTPVTNDKEHK